MAISTLAPIAARLQPPIARPTQSTFLGTIVSALTGCPVAGADIKLVFLEPELTADGSRTSTLLGQGVSDPTGAFSIQLPQTSLVQERLCLLQYFSGASIAWQVALDSQSISTDIVTRKNGGASEVTLTAGIPPVTLSVGQWTPAHARLTQAKIVQAHPIVAQSVKRSTPWWRTW